MLSTLRQPRYAALGVLMIVVAIVCVAAGTWQIARFEQKRHENDSLRANAHDRPVAVSRVLPLVGQGRAPSERSVEFRAVTVTGRYDAAGQTLVRSRTVGDSTGFLVLTPLRTSGGPALLVVRGFVAQPDSGGVPTVAAPPAGTVTVTARTHAPEARRDQAARLTAHQVQSINPAEQQPRLGYPLFAGYAELEANQPGTAGLQALPGPDLSNPAGGALEPQHFAYVIQWYLFAALALAAPFVMARAETKHKEREFDEEPVVDEPSTEPVVELTAEQRREAKLADRYGRAR